MKLREADQITQFIFTDDIHGISMDYDWEENGQIFVIEYNHTAKLVTIHGNENRTSTWIWRGTTDEMTQAFRAWLYTTINSEIKIAKEK